MPAPIDISFQADISNLTQQLAALPGMTEKEAKGMVKALTAQMKKAEKAAEKAAAKSTKAWKGAAKATDSASFSAKEYSSQLKDVQEVTGETDSVFKALGGAIGTVSPEAEKALSTMGDLAGGAEAAARSGAKFAGSLAVIGIAVGAAALAHQHFNAELTEATDKMDAAATAARDMSEAMGGFKTSKARAELELLVALGQENQEVLDKAIASDQAAASMVKAKREAVKWLAAAEKEHTDALEQKTVEQKKSGAISLENEHRLIKAAKILKTRKGVIEGLKTQEKDYADTLYNRTVATRAASKSTKRATKSTKDQTDAIGDLIKATEAMVPEKAQSDLEMLSDQADVLAAAWSGASDEVQNRLQPAIDLVDAAFDRLDAAEQAEAFKDIVNEGKKFTEVSDPIAKGVALLEQLEGAATGSASGMADLESVTKAVAGKLAELDALKDPIKLDESGTLGATRENVARLTAEKKRLADAQSAYAETFGKTSDKIAAKQGEVTASITANLEEIKRKQLEVFNVAEAIAANYGEALAQFATLATDAVTKQAAAEMDARREAAEAMADELANIESAIGQAKDSATRDALEKAKLAKEKEIAAEAEKTEKIEAIKNAEILKSFQLQQGLQASVAIMSGAAAMVRAFAELGPIAGAVASGAIAAMTAAQVATIYSAEPPTAHLGGMIGGPNTTPDERIIKARTGEAVLTAQGVDAVGGPGGVNAANQGRGSSGAIVVQQVYRHKVLDTVLQDSIKRGGAITSELNRRGRRGRRNPYRRAG